MYHARQSRSPKNMKQVACSGGPGDQWGSLRCEVNTYGSERSCLINLATQSWSTLLLPQSPDKQRLRLCSDHFSAFLCSQCEQAMALTIARLSSPFLATPNSYRSQRHPFPYMFSQRDQYPSGTPGQSEYGRIESWTFKHDNSCGN